MINIIRINIQKLYRIYYMCQILERTGDQCDIKLVVNTQIYQ